MQDYYHLLVESISDYAIFMLDREGRITTWNVGAQKMKGYNETEVIGRYFDFLFTQEDKDKDKPRLELKIALKNGRYEEEGWRLKKDGTKFRANIILTPVYSESKEHVGFAKITRDLTEKKRSEELYLLLVNQVKEYAIFMMDVNGQILTWNDGAERIKGYLPTEIIGKHFSAFYTPEDQANNKPVDALYTAIRNGIYQEEGWRVKKDGTHFWASVTITPIYTDRHIGFAKVTRDLTEKREIEKLNKANLVLEASNKELERFASTASHDLKEPLRKIVSFSDLLISGEGSLTTERKSEYLKKVNSSAKRMDRMIEDILNFASLSRRQHFESCNLSDILSSVLELLEHQIKEKNAEVRHDDLPRAVVIPTQMQRLFQNLISNSIKFSKEDQPPAIHISHRYLKKEMVNDDVWPADEYLEIKFNDNGIGFEQVYAERIFNLFDRLNANSVYEGSGLGLAISKKIAENHGGSLKASAHPGEGAEFVLTIPA